MAFKVYNTLGREKQEFTPINKGEVRIYSCGPTVYNYMHIGNLRAFVFSDLLKRYLRFKGYNVIDVMNITDVDDKTIRDSQKVGKSLNEFCNFYTDIFLNDLKALKVVLPWKMPKATDYITEMIDLTKAMLEKGKAYEKNGSVYAKISAIENYGELALLDKQQLKENADNRLNDADEYEKENAQDFALWKAYSESDGDVYWDSPWGKGRPGWHIECSAMSMKLLGKSFDIHTGGIDLIFPHHTNEIAQSESVTNQKFVNYWLHNAHLIVNGEKMSKSLGNFFTLKDLHEKGYDDRSIRYELIKTHYRMQLDFNEEELKQIPQTLQKFDEVINKLQTVLRQEKEVEDTPSLPKNYVEAFEKEMDDDLNVSGGLASVFDFLKEVNSLLDENKVGSSEAAYYLEILQKFDSVLGVMDFTNEEIPAEVTELAEKRLVARNEKRWDESDSLRDKISELGYTILDDKEGYRLKKN